MHTSTYERRIKLWSIFVPQSARARLEGRPGAASLGSRGDFDLPRHTGWLRNRVSKLMQRSYVPLNRFPDIVFGFFQRSSSSHATWKIRNVGSPVLLRSFKNDRV